MNSTFGIPSNPTQVLKVNMQVRYGLAIFLFLLIYDGALRKWLFPGAEQLIFIAKDVLLFGIIILVILSRRGNPAAFYPRTVKFVLLAYASWVLLDATNFSLPNLFVPLWGIKAHLLYAGILILVPLAFGSVDQLLTALEKLYPWLVIPVFFVAMLQLVSPDSSFINQTINDQGAGTSFFGDARLVRVTGTFSYITGMAAFVQMAGLVGIGLLIAGARSRWFFVGLALAMALLPSTGSRSVILVMGVGVLVMLLAACIARLVKFSQAVYFVCIGGLLLLISFYSQDTAWVALQQRSESASHDHYRILTTFTNAFRYFDVAGLFGYGTGSANYGSVALTKGMLPFSWLPMGNRFEEESGRIVIELGILGWAFSLMMRFVFVLWAVRLSLRGGGRSARCAAVIALPALALGFYQGNGVFSPPLVASYYWFCVALLAMAQYDQRQFMIRRPLMANQNPQDLIVR